MSMDPVTRADQAKSVITNPTFVDAFRILDAAYKDRMAATGIDEVQERNKWHACLFVLNDVKTALEATIRNGKVELENAKLREKAKNDGSGKGNRDKRNQRTSSKTT